MRLVSVIALSLLLSALVCDRAITQKAENAIMKIGGFRCISLKQLKNDSTFDLYSIGYWSYAGFSMEVFKRHGVPFWYPRESGNIRVAGPDWQPAKIRSIALSTVGSVAKADASALGNGQVDWANDGNPNTYWYAGDGRPNGKLWIEFPRVARVDSIRFLGWKTPRHAPKDYSVGVLLPDGSWKELHNVSDEKRIGEWISFSVDGVEAKGIFIEVRATMENEHGPVIYELQAEGELLSTSGSADAPIASEVEIPLGDIAAKEIFFLGNVADPGEASLDGVTDVGEYVVNYADGKTESLPLVVGKNVASIQYGHFVPEAEVAFAFKAHGLPWGDKPGSLFYHLDEMLPVPARKQLMMFSHAISDGAKPIRSITFRCTNPKASLILAGLTVRENGPRMNALAYNGRRVPVYPANTPKATPSPLGKLRDKQPHVKLDGIWQYATDPGNLGTKLNYFSPEFDASDWKTMRVPSQWYVDGLDYHGVVWFRREFDVPKTFSGSVLELEFGAVDYDARVWVNGEYVGRHIGAYSSFTLDATKAIKKGAKNLIVVRVDSPLDPGFTGDKTLIKGNSGEDICMPYNQEGCQGGIYRSVRLVGRGSIGIADAWTDSKVSEDLKQATVKISLLLKTSDSKPHNVKLLCTLTEPASGKQTPRAFSASKTLTISKYTPVAIDLKIDKPKLWYPWEQGKPELHLLKIEVQDNGKTLDQHSSLVGIREVSFNEKESCVYVNHHRVFLKGMLNDDVHWMSLMDRTGYRQRIQMQKDANLNIIRVIGHQSSPDFYELCDAMGMMVWQEMPLQWGYSSTEPIRRNIVDVVSETVKQCRPHACVIGWSAWNEGGQQEFSEELVKTIRSLDPTGRPISKACGGGSFDIHIYPNLAINLSKRTPMWAGVKQGFVSEVGAYGLSSLNEIREIVGQDILPFDSADYYWETWNSYRIVDGPVFLDSPTAGDWSTEEIRAYIEKKVEPSQRWLAQWMKFMYENFRALRFAPTTSAIHCRFDDPMPTAFLGVVNFNGVPRRAYYSAKQACQQVLPIINFGYTFVHDIRVVNDYWFKGWKNCKLWCKFTDTSGEVFFEKTCQFDLPPDSTVVVVKTEDIPDVYGRRGFVADLKVTDADGRVLSTNHYELTEDELWTFVTSVYPTPPFPPYGSFFHYVTEAVSINGVSDVITLSGIYSPNLIQLGGPGCPNPKMRFTISAPQDGEYVVRFACDSGKVLRQYDLWVDNNIAQLENYAHLDAEQGITRVPYSKKNLSWYPGWRVKLTKGVHTIDLTWPEGGTPAPPLVIDAMCAQYLKPTTPTY